MHLFHINFHEKFQVHSFKNGSVKAVLVLLTATAVDNCQNILAVFVTTRNVFHAKFTVSTL